MNRISPMTRLTRKLPTAAAVLLLGAAASYAQVPVDADGNPLTPLDAPAGNYDNYDDVEAVDEALQPLTPAELQTLIGPVALYPDDLLAIVLPASTYPLEIVQAARFLEAYEIDSSLTPDDDWDESITALLNYPEVLEMLNEDIDWTWKLGEAVVRQQQDVIAAVETFRDRAYAAGNLRSDEYQNVSDNEGVIEIVPIEDDIIYVPYYEPEHVVVSQARPVYHYYPTAHPVYYYPYPYGHSFTRHRFWGVTTAFRMGWATDFVHVHHQSYWGHPYYGRTYFGNNYRRPSLTVHNTVYVNTRNSARPKRHRDGDYWTPRKNRGARPNQYRASTRSYRDSSVSPGNYVSRTVNTTTTRTRDRDRTRRTKADFSDTFRERPAQTANRRTTTAERTTRRLSGTARNDEIGRQRTNRVRPAAVPRPAAPQRQVESRRTERSAAPVTQRLAARATAPSRAAPTRSSTTSKRSTGARSEASRSNNRSRGRENSGRTRRQ